eukprot:4216731-Prymnesium_polylepis.1
MGLGRGLSIACADPAPAVCSRHRPSRHRADRDARADGVARRLAIVRTCTTARAAEAILSGTPRVLTSVSAALAATHRMSMEEPVARRELLSKVLGASAMLGAAAANAEIDYAGVGYLGGASIIDVNNANIRVYHESYDAPGG